MGVSDEQDPASHHRAACPSWPSRPGAQEVSQGQREGQGLGSSIQGSGLPLPALIVVTVKGDFVASAKPLIFEALQKSSPGLTGETPAGCRAAGSCCDSWTVILTPPVQFRIPPAPFTAGFSCRS